MAENNRECWFWNIDSENQKYFATQLKEGKLRQGWGYQENLNLKKIKDKPETDEKDEIPAWEKCHLMLDNIKVDD